MDLRQLTTFRHVAKTLSFSKTAAELDYAQSTVSAQIQALEKELNVTLFDRLGKRILLTHAGHQLLTYADRFQVLEAEARASLNEEEDIAGALTIYAPSTLCVYRLPSILKTYRRRYPHVQINIHANIELSAVPQVRSGAVDVAFDLDRPINAPDMNCRTLIVEPMVFVTYPEHSLVQKEGFTLTDLAGQSLVLSEASCNYRQVLEQMADRAGVLFDSPMGFENVEAIKQCIRAGIGLSFLPHVAVAQEIAEGALLQLPWSGEPITFETQMIWHRERWLSPALTRLIEVVEEVYPS